ncbi:hypothetical protein Tco_0525650 [Tanacetum coccineum]
MRRSGSGAARTGRPWVNAKSKIKTEYPTVQYASWTATVAAAEIEYGMCVLHSNIYVAKANVKTSLSALHIEETSDVMDRLQMLQRHSATNVNVPRLETFDTARCIGTGSGGLKNLADDVGGSKRRSISEPDSVLRREWALRIDRV